MKVVIFITLLFALLDSNQATNGKPRPPGKLSSNRFRVKSIEAIIFVQLLYYSIERTKFLLKYLLKPRVLVEAETITKTNT